MSLYALRLCAKSLNVLLINDVANDRDIAIKTAENKIGYHVWIDVKNVQVSQNLSVIGILKLMCLGQVLM